MAALKTILSGVLRATDVSAQRSGNLPTDLGDELFLDPER